MAGPRVADAEAGFGGPLNAYELMKSMIEAGAAGVHYEDQLASEKKCGHLGGKVLVPTSQHIRTLAAARLAADVPASRPCSWRGPTRWATLLTSDVDERDARSYRGADGRGLLPREGARAAIARALAYAPYADILWFETSTPDLGEARESAEAINEQFPGKWLTYNCSPSFNWRRQLDDPHRPFQEELGMGYRYQFVTLAGLHALNLSCSSSPPGTDEDMAAYVSSSSGVRARGHGYTATAPARGRRRLLRPIVAVVSAAERRRWRSRARPRRVSSRRR